jgi:hypothetical protein
VGWAAGVVLIGGVAYVLTAEDSPIRPFGDPVVTETSINEVVVLPVGQAEVSGTFTRLEATGANGPAVPLPITVTSGTAVIDGALLEGERAVIAWEGGRPLHLDGSGGIDLGPTAIRYEGGTATWPLDDGVRILLPGDYVLEAPTAVGSEGLAAPRDRVAFRADEETSIETAGWTVSAPMPSLHLDGPGGVILEGDLVVRTRDGERHATRLALAEGPYVVDVRQDGTLTATVRGDLDVS